jgi:excisionase family DNA binding protein
MKMTPAGNEDRLERLAYGIEEVARCLGVSPRTVRNLLKRGELVRRKIGARTVIPRSSIERFLTRDHATKIGENE